jgi:hypothetical protein
MQSSDYPEKWQAAAPILAGLLPQTKGRRHVFISHRVPPPPPPKPLPEVVALRVCAMKWNNDLGMLVDIDD